MYNKTRMISLICFLVIIFNIIFSYGFIVKNSHHKCVGDNCHICYEIKEAIIAINSIKLIPLLVFSIILSISFYKKNIVINTIKNIKETLISLKVELQI